MNPDPATITDLTSSRPARGAWVEIMANASLSQIEWLSRPARGAWVEIGLLGGLFQNLDSRAPQGARGLKCLLSFIQCLITSRAPQGARGLKFLTLLLTKLCKRSRPARGAWVEIVFILSSSAHSLTSRPARGAWVEMFVTGFMSLRPKRRAPQGARGLKFLWSF